MIPTGIKDWMLRHPMPMWVFESMVIVQVIMLLAILFLDWIPRATRVSISDGVLYLVAGFALGLACAAITIANKRPDR